MKIETTKDKLVFALGVICLLYILNPGFGLFEIIPDHIPLIGNIDEGAAAMLLLSCLKYFGINLTDFFKRTT
jgi:uncharacterized membrane protein YkvA (DUF1232 family)